MLNTLSKTCYFEIVWSCRNRSINAIFTEDFIEFIFDNLQLIEYKCLINCPTGGTPIWNIDWVFVSIGILMWRRNSGNNFRFSKTNGFPTIVFPFLPNNIGFGWNSVKVGGCWLSENLWSPIYDFRLPFDWLSFIRLLWRGLFRKIILWLNNGALFMLSLSILILNLNVKRAPYTSSLFNFEMLDFAIFFKFYDEIQYWESKW